MRPYIWVEIWKKRDPNSNEWYHCIAFVLCAARWARVGRERQILTVSTFTVNSHQYSCSSNTNSGSDGSGITIHWQVSLNLARSAEWDRMKKWDQNSIQIETHDIVLYFERKKEERNTAKEIISPLKLLKCEQMNYIREIRLKSFSIFKSIRWVFALLETWMNALSFVWYVPNGRVCGVNYWNEN